MTECDQDMQPDINSFFPKLILVMVFHHSNRKPIGELVYPWSVARKNAIEPVKEVRIDKLVVVSLSLFFWLQIQDLIYILIQNIGKISTRTKKTKGIWREVTEILFVEVPNHY